MASMKSGLILCGVWNSLREGGEGGDVESMVPLKKNVLPRNLLLFIPSSTQWHLVVLKRCNKYDYYVLFSVLRKLIVMSYELPTIGCGKTGLKLIQQKGNSVLVLAIPVNFFF